jgi:hypothetical protein
MLIMEGEAPEQRLVKSSVAANKLGISKASLNRMAPIYEQVHGELPRGGRHVRLWSLEAIERIRRARLAVEESRAETIEAALRGFETPEDTQSSQMPARISEGTPEVTRAPPRALEELAGELHALREVLEDQNKLLNMLLRVEAHRLQRLEAGSPLPVATAYTSEKASLETTDGTESSAEDQKDGEDVRQTSTDRRRVFLRILPIMLPIPPIVVTVMSALYMDALLLTASLVVVAISLLFIWYYYDYAKAGRRTADELAEAEAQENQRTGTETEASSKG